MKKFVFFFLTLLLVSCVHGDGGGYYYTYGRDTLYPLSESSQTALINYEDGVEDLLISIRTNPEGDGLFWIFPVPSNPEDSEIELVEEFPQISGYEPKSKLGLEIKNTRDLMYLSQIYPSSFLMNPLFIVGRGGGTYQESRKDNGISIHQSVEKSGVVSQLISCRDEGGLSNYLSGKGFSVPEDLKSVVEEYIGENYSFVVSWITNKEEYREGLEEGDIALRVKFSTEKIFYPLKMTSIYGEERIPIHVYVLGRVTPELYEDIEYGSVNYFISNEYEIPSELSSFFNADGTIKGLKYSRVRIYTESINLGEDLWFSEGVSNRILLADYLAPLTPIINILFFALFSCLASLVAGLVVYRGKVSLKELIFLGLSNFLTLIGFSIIASRVLSKKPELAGREEKKNRRIWYIPFLLPFAIMIILLIIVGYPIYYDLIQFALYYLFLFIILVYLSCFCF